MKQSRIAAAEAFRLRAWARKHLGGESASPPPASARAWGIFLRWERCALLLQESLNEAATPMPEHAHGVLRAFATNEMRYILSARAQLRTIAAVARATDARVLVLKGTADVARGINALVTDVDILASPEDAQKVAVALDERGFVPRQQDTIWHLRPRTAADALAIEVHTAVTGFDTPADVPWRDARALPGIAPLLELAPHDHAWTILNQAARKHPERRTRVRDLLLLRRALESASQAGRAALQRRIDATHHAAVMQDMIARAVANSSAPNDDAEQRLLRVYLMQARISGEPVTVRGRIERTATECLAIGSRANWRRSMDPSLGGGRHWRWRWFALLPGHALAVAAAHLLTLDAAFFDLSSGPAAGSESRPFAEHS